MKTNFLTPILTQGTLFTKSLPGNRRLVKSFEKQRSHPSGPGWVEMQKEAQRLDITPKVYKQQFQAWLGGAA